MLPIGIVLTLATFVVALAATRLVIRHAVRLKLVAIPNHRSSHHTPTPTGGGLAIVLAGTLSALPLLLTAPTLALPVLLAGFGMAAMGYVDDRKALSPRHKLAAQVLLSALALAPVPLDTVAASLGVVAPDLVLFAIALFAVALWVNLYNFMDGIDGLAGSEAVAVLLGATLLALLQQPAAAGTPLLWWMAGVAVASAGFLVFNWAPARIFMGDTGSTWLGLMIAILALATVSVGWLTAWQWLILVALFLADSLATLGRRALRGQPLWRAHREHAYQHLARRWGRHDRVTLLYLAIDVLVLLPLAGAAGLWREAGAAIALATLLVLAAAMLTAGAGSGEQADEERARADDRQ
jgi:Fuc2NAc and GlcNAc transferase